MKLLLCWMLLMRATLASAQTLNLPANFHFGVSTAAHQVEGGNTGSDWWEWESTPGKIKNSDTSLIATDSWNHVDEDIQNMVALKIDTYRFSIEWAKIEPKENEFDEKVLDRYIEFIDKLKANHIEPMVTLQHFTLPTWVSHRGGWQWNGIRDAFNGFVIHAVTKIGPRVRLWITINEPMSLIAGGYVGTVFPPAKNDIGSIGLPMANMIRAHADAYHSIHKILDSSTFTARVGLAHHLRIFDPLHPRNPVGKFLAKEFDKVFNWAIPDALTNGTLQFSVPLIAKANFAIPEAAHTQDFFGLNYYSRDLLTLNPFANPPIERVTKTNVPVTDLGWEIYPEGMDRLITSLHARYPDLKVWLTENGIADDSDTKRAGFLQSHLQVISDQIAKGVQIEGYCHWTLNDNFEWAEGYAAHFGLFSLEPGTLKRVPRPSADFYKKIIESTRLKTQAPSPSTH